MRSIYVSQCPNFFQDNLLWREKCRESGLLDSDIDHNLRYELKHNPNMVYSQRKVSSGSVKIPFCICRQYVPERGSLSVTKR